MHLRESAGQAHPALDADVGDPFDARHGVVGEVAQHAHAVEGGASGEAQGDGRAGTDSALRRRRGATLATREGAQCARGQVVDLPHGVVELPDAAEPARERHLRGGQLGAGEQRAGRFRAVRAGESEGAGAEFRRHDAREMPRAVAEVRGETRHAVALDHAVEDEPHRAPHEIVAQVPLRVAGGRVGLAALAGPQPGLVPSGRSARCARAGSSRGSWVGSRCPSSARPR